MQSMSENLGFLTQPSDPLLLELSYLELQQDNRRLRQIIAELLVKNQVLRWTLQGGETTSGTDPRWLAVEDAA